MKLFGERLMGFLNDGTHALNLSRLAAVSKERRAAVDGLVAPADRWTRFAKGKVAKELMAHHDMADEEARRCWEEDTSSLLAASLGAGPGLPSHPQEPVRVTAAATAKALDRLKALATAASAEVMAGRLTSAKGMAMIDDDNCGEELNQQ